MYIAHSDGSTQHLTGQSGISYVIRSPKGRILYRLSKPIIEYDSMISEYEAIIELIQKAIELKIPTLLIKSDCKYICDNLSGMNLHKINFKHLDHFVRAADLISQHRGIRVEWVPRERNKFADKLCKKARKTGKLDVEEVENLESMIRKTCVKRIVKRNKFLLIKCKTCKEPKSVDQFPPKQINGDRRSCFHCMGKLNLIHSF
jgi:ribonuclease HI